MSNALDMSLDDLIKNNKKSGGGNLKGKGRGSTGLGPTRRQTKRSGKRPAPYSGGKALESEWQHDMYSNQMPAYPSPATRVSSIETGSKIYISNLDYGVSNEDIKELFSEFGDLKRYSIHYDRSGRSKGTAEVVFARKVDALAAVKRYNDVQLDGKPMKIEIVGSNMEKPAATTRLSGGGFQSSNRVSRRVQERVGTARSDRRRGGGRGRGKGPKQVSASELDADLEKYHAQISEICVIKLMHPTRDSLAATNLHTPKYWPPHSQGVNYMISDGCGGICLLDARGKPHISKKKSLHFYVLYLWSLNVHYF